MELLIAKENDMWTAHIGKYKFESPSLPLVPASESLYRLVAAIHKTYPGTTIWIDPSISDNPFLAKRLFNTRHYGMTPSYEWVQYALDNSEVKECTLCHAQACYDPDIRVWVCTRCHAEECRGEFIKLARRRKE